MKLTNHMIALDFEHKRNYVPTEMGITLINNNFTVGETYHYYITDEQLPKNKKSHENAKSFYEVWEEIQHLFPKDVLIISHNYGTEKKVINQCFERCNIDKKYTIDDFFDTMWIIPAKLEVVCRSFDIPTENHHRADADSRMAAEIFCKYMNGINPSNYDIIIKEASDTGRNGLGLYQQMISYETELLRYCKRNNINYNEILSWLGNDDLNRIVELLDGKISKEFNDCIETESDYWIFNDCKINEESLKYIYEMRILNEQTLIPDISVKRFENKEKNDETIDKTIKKIDIESNKTMTSLSFCISII